MDAPSWNRVKEIIEGALERAPGERARFVHETCGDDRALQTEVESLLSAMAQAGSLVEHPALHALASPDASAVGGILDLAGRALQPGDLVGPYHVLDFVGAGGMGEVYRARDSKLNRDIALKVLPKALAIDPDRLARFSQEARVLASLNHSNIASIFGFEESDGVQAIALEFVEGPTLADRIATGTTPIEEALSIAEQIANGLESAHDRGIVHRDLKPGNIKLRPDGTVKILDFGLAKALEPVGEISRSVSTTLESPAVTGAGVLVGTAAYMSPEQARGKTADTRTDVWAFGCVLYETLTGQRAFPGETIQDTLAAVLVHEPDWSLLPTATPESVVKLLRRCLEKDPRRRLHAIADARLEIEEAGSPRIAAPTWRGRLAYPLLAVAALAVVGVAVWGPLRPADPTPALTVRRLLIGLPGSRPLAQAASMPLGVGQPSFAISPDGTRIAYVLEVQGARQLFVHQLDQLEGMAIARTDGAFGPFFSPDGHWIGFFAENKVKKVAVSGGTPMELGSASNPLGGSWGEDGTILFAADEGRRPMRIRDSGGVPERVLVKDDRGSWTQPDILPGGHAAIVTNPHLGVGVLSLETGAYRELVEGGFSGRYVSSGHIVFARAGALLAAPFDLERLALNGPSTVILEGIRTEGPAPLAHAAYSREGTLVYVPGIAAKNATSPVWVDRLGNVEPVGMPPRSYRAFHLSPDGRRLAIQISDPDNDVWVQDLERGTLMRLTSGGNNIRPSWMPDGTRVVFARQTGGRAARAYSVAADGRSEPQPMFTADSLGTVGSFSPKGDVVTVQKRSPDTGLDIWVRPLRGDQADQPFLRTPSSEVGSKFSPNGRWISYVSDESGQSEVYVRAYPGPGAKWQLSTNGGGEGTWSRDGKEFFYRNGNKWMVVPVTSEPEFNAGTPRLLFEGTYVNVGGLSYDVSPDGRRFLLFQTAEETAGPVRHLNVVLNWFEDVKRRTGPGGTVAQR